MTIFCEFHYFINVFFSLFFLILLDMRIPSLRTKLFTARESVNILVSPLTKISSAKIRTLDGICVTLNPYYRALARIFLEIDAPRITRARIDFVSHFFHR